MRTSIPTSVLAALSVAASLGLVMPSAAQQPIRIGASLSQTGTYAPFGAAQGRGYQLCIKHENEKGGLLGRRIDLLIEDDRSEPATAARIYARFITQDKVDAILGPFSSSITEAVADVAEKHRVPMVAPGAATPSIFKKGRKFVFQVVSPAEAYFDGLVDIAAKRGLRTLAGLNEDTLFPTAAVRGAVALAKKKGLQVVLAEAYPKGTSDFAPLLTKVRAANPDVLVAPAFFDEAVAITRQLKELNVNPRMFAMSTGAELPKFYEVLGRTAEYVYGASPWEPELVTLRAGGLVPIARQYPGAREFVESYKQEFPGAELSQYPAAGYGACQVLVEAIRRAASLDGEKVRAAILKMDLNTVHGAFKVDQDGLQIAHKMVTFQWQDGKKVIVWPEELAPGKPRFPTPPWSQRP